jgi:hypothetical protein
VHPTCDPCEIQELSPSESKLDTKMSVSANDDTSATAPAVANKLPNSQSFMFSSLRTDPSLDALSIFSSSGSFFLSDD